jgi:hypothetical protein
MNIRHRPIFDVEKVTKHYSEKDGVPVKYVCTSAPNKHADYAADIYYRETPHPEFGNRYFGLYQVSTGPKPEQRQIRITNVDMIEDLDFTMVEVDDQLHYSQHRHDFCSFENGNMIDGGRSYSRSSGVVTYYKVVNGEFVENSLS